MSREIDQIFSERASSKAPRSRKEKKQREESYNIRGTDVLETDIFSCDGYKIYTQEELNIGKGGLTDKCPIDCNCCF
ncbi:uncharacterized protein NEMAJ01_0504 [Nematocida major]|uniref:uncharacterized protein n=1 Tax=Nematocida major TaxID=1912982 RepID=UPI0020084BCE|nr:uncharacterized protein NEMAJ01_0504 [Nematocida major]KAH9385608.1 hypothetical protein NEMAJ01_0504 [Nematocida major]